jgi:hypothetical protein
VANEIISNFTESWKTFAPAFVPDKYSKTLAHHEWNKHGSCSGLSAVKYFQESSRVFKLAPTPALFREKIGQSTNLRELERIFANRARFTCVNGALSQVSTCWVADSKSHVVLRQTDCPLWLASIKRTNSVPIRRFLHERRIFTL